MASNLPTLKLEASVALLGRVPSGLPYPGMDLGIPLSRNTTGPRISELRGIVAGIFKVAYGPCSPILAYIAIARFPEINLILKSGHQKDQCNQLPTMLPLVSTKAPKRVDHWHVPVGISGHGAM